MDAASYRAMLRQRIYRVLVGSLGIAFLLFGLAMIGSFFAYQRPNSVPLIPTGPVGHYFVAFTGCALLGWAGGLLGAARNPMASRTVSTMTVFVLAVMAVIRMVAWLIGDYSSWLGDLPPDGGFTLSIDRPGTGLDPAHRGRDDARRIGSNSMILRGLATLALLALLGLNIALPSTSLGRRGTELASRVDVESQVALGKSLPELKLMGLDGRVYSREDLLGHRVLLTFERSVDW